MVRYPPLILYFRQEHLCDTPFCNVSREKVAIPHKNQRERVLRYYRYKYCAIWKVSLLGLLAAKLLIWTLRIWGFRGPGFRNSAWQVLCGDASRLFLDYFSKHLSSVLGRTELCHDVQNPGPPKPQIIRNENHHLALFEFSGWGDFRFSKVGCTPRGSCNRTLLRRVLRRFSNSKCFLEGFLEGACKGFQ